jgi:hypothetical protein
MRHLRPAIIILLVLAGLAPGWHHGVVASLWPALVALTAVIVLRNAAVGLLAGGLSGALLAASGNAGAAIKSFLADHLLGSLTGTWHVSRDRLHPVARRLRRGAGGRGWIRRAGGPPHLQGPPPPPRHQRGHRRPRPGLLLRRSRQQPAPRAPDPPPGRPPRHFPRQALLSRRQHLGLRRLRRLHLNLDRHPAFPDRYRRRRHPLRRHQLLAVLQVDSGKFLLPVHPAARSPGGVAWMEYRPDEALRARRPGSITPSTHRSSRTAPRTPR